MNIWLHINEKYTTKRKIKMIFELPKLLFLDSHTQIRISFQNDLNNDIFYTFSDSG